MRTSLRILFCLVGWLMLSPLAVALPPCAMQAEPGEAMACCEADGEDACPLGSASNEAPCDECRPLVPVPAVLAVPFDVAPPLLLSFDAPLTFDASGVVDVIAIVVPFHPPPPTLLTLGTMLTC